MAEYQKFIFSDNYSTEPENLERIQQKKVLDARTMMAEEIESIKKQAFEQGYEEGQKMALEKLKAEMELHINTIIENITKINNFKPELQSIYEQHSTACVRHIAKNMFFKAENMFSDELLTQSVENAVENLPMVSKILVKVPVNTKTYLEDTKITEKIQQRGIMDFAFIEDRSLSAGECRIEWDKSGLLSSKVESFEKVNSTFAAFLSPDDLELSDKTETLALKETIEQKVAPAEQEQIANVIEEDEVVEFPEENKTATAEQETVEQI